MKLETLDGRHALSSFFSHRARMMGTAEIVLFVQIRNWCWENYGPGIDRDTYWALQYHDITDQLFGFDPQWAWHSEDSKRYIYLKEEVLTMFSLKWLNT